MTSCSELEIEGLVERAAMAMLQSFQDQIAASAGRPYEETKVQTPNLDVYRAYARAALKAADITSMAGDLREAREWAKGWHKAVETAEVLMGIGPCLAADEFPAAVQAYVAAAEARASTLAAEVERLTGERDEWKGRAIVNLDAVKTAETAEASLAEALKVLTEGADKYDADGRDLRHDDATRRGYMFAAQLVRRLAVRSAE